MLCSATVAANEAFEPARLLREAVISDKRSFTAVNHQESTPTALARLSMYPAMVFAIWASQGRVVSTGVRFWFRRCAAAPENSLKGWPDSLWTLSTQMREELASRKVVFHVNHVCWSDGSLFHCLNLVS